MLLVSPEQLQERRIAAAGTLASLADSLAADLDAVLARELYVPEAKALLSRAGGRCERDGSMLAFDPFSPDKHRCPTCGETYTGELHHRSWIYPYQLWLAERAVHGASLFAVRGDERHRRLAIDILRRYCDKYASYPNCDNVLGPTRVFFSTYLESIWLLQLCVAVDLLEATGERTIGADVRARIVEPSASLIAQYDEGASNRQVWNNAALMASSLLLGDRAGAERIVRAPSGVEAHLHTNVLPDGMWYEGENYHFFAHRGLWYCLTMADRAGIDVEPELRRKFDEGFAAPFVTALPDLTVPSRKDSQYAVSLRQWRFAEACELGLARGDDARLRGVLARLYTDDIPRSDTGRARSSAEAERNEPASRLTRADLGWRSLLCAHADLPRLEPNPPRSAHQEGQGLSVFRRQAGDVYVALDWGQSGGGHGHPDRLNVLFSHGATRWLDDLGTGSYVDPSLHWYRSTLAHNAPLVNGRSQQRCDGRLVAHDERGDVGWILAEANDIAPGVVVQRALVVTPDYFIDEVRWRSHEAMRFELPIHFDGEPDGVTFVPADLDGGGGIEDGFDFTRDTAIAQVKATGFGLSSERDGRRARGVIWADGFTDLYRTTGPGQPASIRKRFYVLRSEGTHGVIRSVWTWGTRVDSMAFLDDNIVVVLGSERHVHRQTAEYWSMEMTAGTAKSEIELYGWTRTANGERRTANREPRTANRERRAVRGSEGVSWELGEAHYRRSEETWSEAGRPTARISVAVSAGELVVSIVANVGPLVLVASDAVNPYDNEFPDINAHGVQLYVRAGANGGAWVVVPDATPGAARARRLADWGTLGLHGAEWHATPAGFEMTIRVELPPNETALAFDAIINETAPGRERRRGQLVLSGAAGEFVYLRGDRHDPGRLLPLLIAE